MRLSKSALRGLLVTALIAVLAPSKVQACSCGILTPAEHVETSTLIFRGTVKEVLGGEPKRDCFLWFVLCTEVHDSGAEYAARFEIEKSWKGATAGTEITTIQAKTEGSCGWEFKEGWSGLVFARQTEQKGYVTGYCLMAPYHHRSEAMPAYGILLPGHLAFAD